MRLLPGLDINPFCRTVWLSEDARKLWEPYIPKVATLVSELEVLSVARGHRPCAWQTFSDTDLPTNARKWADMGLVSLPVRYAATFEGFAHRHAEPQPGKPKSVCVIVSRSIEEAREFAEAHRKGDHETQGRLLGFPECCRHFFTDVWGRGFYDPMWQIGLNSPHEERGERRIRALGHPLANPLLRYLGIRVGFHMPCSFDCDDTVELAEERLSLAGEVNQDAATILLALLSMPVSWDCYHGVAVIRTPIFYVITSSVPSAERHVVEFDGAFMPHEAVCGAEWPSILVGKP